MTGKPPSVKPLSDKDLFTALQRSISPEWPIDKLMALVRLWEAGITSPAIGLRLGTTKSSITGRVNRLAARGILAHRPSPILPANALTPEKRHKQRQDRLRRLKARIDVPAYPAPPPPPKVTYVAPYLGRVTSCCWPIGRPSTPGFHFCEKPSEPGKVYCERHVKTAYVRIRPPDVHTQISAPGRMGHVGRKPG